ncbi:harmonin-binding protein USHBP1 [Liasis olivaceus]
MEKQEGEPPGTEEQEEASGEEALLHYEERITELLVTIARLQGKIERLQRNEAREEENFSDLGSESTASLPRCPSLFASRTRSPPPPPAGPEEGKADLFLDVHKAVTSLENVVLSYRSCLPSAEAELEGYARVAEGLEAKLMKLQQGSLGPFRQEAPAPAYERTVALYKERNAALRAELGAKEEALRRSSASLSAYQEERSKLQRKVRELHGSLSRVEIRSDGAPRPLGEREPRGAQDPLGAAQDGLRAPRGATGIQPACTLSASAPTETHSTPEQLHRSVERLGRLNRLLSGALQESKTAAERISLLLGRQESDHTALALAARCSERCLEAFETLWALTATEDESEDGGGAPWAGEAAQRWGPLLAHAPSGWLGPVQLLPPLPKRLCTAPLEDPLQASLRGQRPLAGPSPNGHNSLPPEVRARASALTLPPWSLLAGGPDRSSPALDRARRFLQACSAASKSSREQDGIQESSLELLGSEEDAKARLRECIGCLRAEQGSLKLPAPQPPPGPGSVAARLNAGIGAKAAEGRRAVQEALPGPAPRPKVEKAQLPRELHAAREALVDLGTRLHLTAKEKQGLELRTHTLQAQEAACLLVIQTLQQEQRDLRGQPAPSSGSSSSGGSSSGCAPVGVCRRSPPAASENVDGSLGGTEPEASRRPTLLDTSARLRGPECNVQRPAVGLKTFRPGIQNGTIKLAAFLHPVEYKVHPPTLFLDGWQRMHPYESKSPSCSPHCALPACWGQPKQRGCRAQSGGPSPLSLLPALGAGGWASSALVLMSSSGSARCRIQGLQDRLEALLTDLEERSQDCKAREAQEMELLWDFFQAHSALLLAYQKARRKQESQVGKLETQMGLMSGRQAKQRQALMRTLRQLQDRVPVGAPTGLPQAPVLDVRTLDSPGSLEATSFFTEEKVRLSGHIQTRLQASQGVSPTVISH